MKKFLFKIAFAVTFLSIYLSNSVIASHAIGGEITYSCIAPNIYLVNCKFYRDCTGATPPNVLTLNLKPTGCTGGRSVNMQQAGASVIGNPYCSQIPQTCSYTRANHEEVSFSTVVTFTAAEAACPDWILSFTESGHPNIANLTNPQNTVYCEAYLKLGLNIGNSSATMNEAAPAAEYVCLNQETRISLTAYDPDCDSLSYELVAPLSAAGVAYTYAPITTGPSGYIVNPNPNPPFNPTTNPQIGVINNLPATYSPTFPILSYNLDWNAINPATGLPNQIVTGTPYFKFNSRTGELAFKPAIYHNSPPTLGENKYTIVVKINEWRKINGIATKVGYTRCEMLFNVEDCGGNENPSIVPMLVNGQLPPNDSILTVQAGATLHLQFATTDQFYDTVRIDSNVKTKLPGAIFTQSAAKHPVGTITWVAPATNVLCGVRYFYVRVQDNACPIKGKKAYVFGVKVVNSGSPTGIKENIKNELTFTAFPNPFSEEVNFRIDAANYSQQIKIFNVLGQEIEQLIIPAGEQNIQWQSAFKHPAGTYIAKLQTKNNSVKTLKFTKLQ